jgi:hypothetical protein
MKMVTRKPIATGKPLCKKQLWSSFGSSPCRHVAIGQHGYCGVHSPETKAKRDAAYEVKWASKKAQWDEERRERIERERKLAAFDNLLVTAKALLNNATLFNWDTDACWVALRDSARAAIAAAETPTHADAPAPEEK